jgi:hypothetical protein
MRAIVLAKLLSVTLLLLYLFVGLTRPPGDGREASRAAPTRHCT